LGTELGRVWPQEHPSDRVVRLDHGDLDVVDADAVRRVLLPIGPQLVVNTTAYNLVDVAEADPLSAFQVNAIGARNLALAARQLDAVLVHVSTDYVFSGSRRQPYVETDPVDPLSVYGVSKAAGEGLVRAAWPKHFIVRTCGLYGVTGSRGKGGNFVETLLRLGASGELVRVVADQVLTPTSAADLAAQIARLAATDAYGTYHATCQGECSWFEFAAEIFQQAGMEPPLEPQTTTQAARPARRPQYSVLDNRGLQRLGIDLMPGWRQSLANYLAGKSASVS
jgi:dTDP-4-dehydrorhamnose reductase